MDSLGLDKNFIFTWKETQYVDYGGTFQSRVRKM